MIIELPWPPAKLSSNGTHGRHWRVKQVAAKAYRADCDILCRSQGLGKCQIDRAHLTMTFHPPDRRRRDLDNMLASAKQAIDAIAERIGVDDYHFGFTILRAEPVKNGKVVIHIEEA